MITFINFNAFGAIIDQVIPDNGIHIFIHRYPAVFLVKTTIVFNIIVKTVTMNTNSYRTIFANVIKYLIIIAIVKINSSGNAGIVNDRAII